jgi:acetyl esterase
MRSAIFFSLLVCVACPAEAQERKKRPSQDYPPHMEAAQVEKYKLVDGVQLRLWVFTPDGHKPGDRRPAIVFFFGGGWTGGSPQQFEQHSKHLAARGMVAITADYRVASRHGVKAKECVADAKSAIRWVRKHAEMLGVDPDRIAAGGGSAGGHLAACTALIPGFDESEEDAAVSSVPNALVLFNPAVVLAPVERERPIHREGAGSTRDRLGVDPVLLSPYHHVKEGAPPTIILHGRDDSTVPFRSVVLFSEAMHATGARCKLVGYPGQGHGFFNYGRGDNDMYRRTLASVDEFLTELGYLEK